MAVTDGSRGGTRLTDLDYQGGVIQVINHGMPPG